MQGELQIQIACDKPDGLYQVGEKAVFSISVLQGDAPVSNGRLSVYTAQDGGPGRSRCEELELSQDSPATVCVLADEPCFFLCRAEYNGAREEKVVWYRTEAQVEKIRELHLLPGTPLCASLEVTAMDPPEPADFDDFWENTLGEARKLPYDMQFEELTEYALPAVRCYRFAMNTLNKEQVHGFLSIPNGQGPFSVVAMFPGKGAPAVSPVDCGWGQAGCIAVNFSVHKFRSPGTQEEAVAAMKSYALQHGVDDYWKVGAESRETFHFYTVIPGFCRVLDYVTEKLPWDRKHLVITGGSQGGWMTLAISALYREKVSALYAGVPACGLASGLRAEEERRYLPYYDGDSFARRVTAPALIATGLNDTSIARPDTICAMFSLLGSQEKRLAVDNGEHMNNPLRQEREHQFLAKHLGLSHTAPERIPPFSNELTAIRGGMLRSYYRKLSEQTDRRRQERLSAIRSVEDFELYRREIKEKIHQVFGPFPKPQVLSPQVTDLFSTGKLIIDKVLFQSRPGFYVSALFYRPKDRTEVLPGILFLCGHNAEGKAAPTYDRTAQSLALRGFGVLSVDPYGQGERREFGGGPAAEHNFFGRRLALMGEFFGTWRLYDALCALEYLKSRPEIDGSRLGVTGCSGGGTLTSYVNAFSDKLIMAAPVCSMTRMSSNLENEVCGDCEQNPPFFRALGLDEDDLFLVQAPRPVMFGVQSNDFFDPRGTQSLLHSVQKIYALLGCETAAKMSFGPGEHGFAVHHQQNIGRFFAEIAHAVPAGDDGDIEAFSREHFNCTPSGSVLDLPGALPASQILSKLYEGRKHCALTLERLGIRELKAPAYSKGIQQYIASAKLYANRFSLQVEPGIEVVLKKLSRRVEKVLPSQETIVLFLPDQDGLREVDLRDLRQDPENFYILEVRGCGESLPARLESDVSELFTNLYAANALMFGDELFLCRIRDILSALMLFKELGTKEVVLLASERRRALASAAASFSPVRIQLGFAAELEPWKKYLESLELPLAEDEYYFGAL